MIILPAIDLKNGKCVRLQQGQKNAETIYFDDPLAVAKHFEADGAQYLHLVDLDGAFDGIPRNLELIKKITETLNIPVELGGGIRTYDIAEKYLEIGISRIIIGTQAVKDPLFVQTLLDRYHEKICVSIDAKDNFVQTEGWVENSNIDVLTLAGNLEKMGLSTLVYTDISKDGMLSGPNFEMLEKLNTTFNLDIIASGGISKVEDLNRLEKMNLYGAITGKALYEGTINLGDYLQQ